MGARVRKRLVRNIFKVVYLIHRYGGLAQFLNELLRRLISENVREKLKTSLLF